MTYKGWTNRETYSANACLNFTNSDMRYWMDTSQQCDKATLIDKMKHSYRYWVGDGLFDVSPDDAAKVDWIQIANAIKGGVD